MKLSIVAALSFALSGCVVTVTDDTGEKLEYVNNATIEYITTDVKGFPFGFAVKVKGGTGACADKLITFDRVGANNTGKRIFSMAQMALLEKRAITIGNNESAKSDCSDARYMTVI